MHDLTKFALGLEADLAREEYMAWVKYLDRFYSPVSIATSPLVVVPTGLSGHHMVTGYEVVDDHDHRFARFPAGTSIPGRIDEEGTALALEKAQEFVRKHTKQNVQP